MIAKRMDYLRKVDLFSDLTGNETALQEFANIMEDRSYRAGQGIIGDELESGEMFFLLEGKASVFKTTVEGESFKVAILDGKNHAFFGEGGLIDPKNRSATIQATTDCRCFVLKKESFDRFSQEHPEWALPFYRRISQNVLLRLRKTNSDLALLYKALISEISGQVS